MLMGMIVPAQCRILRMRMFMRSIYRMHMIVGMIVLDHDRWGERFVRATTPADGQR